MERAPWPSSRPSLAAPPSRAPVRNGHINANPRGLATQPGAEQGKRALGGRRSPQAGRPNQPFARALSPQKAAGQRWQPGDGRPQQLRGPSRRLAQFRAGRDGQTRTRPQRARGFSGKPREWSLIDQARGKATS